jgi:hypothetical protein
MPIRINLLAEEQAAEEMRRRDPIKRAIFAGAALAVVMIFWIGITQVNVIAARRELSNYEDRFKKVDDSSKQVRNNQMASADLESKIKALQRYSTNRLLWGTLLDALQFTVVDHIRFTDVRTDQTYDSGDVHKFFITNVAVEYVPPAPWWKPWARGETGIPPLTQASNLLAGITNKAPFTTNTLPYAMKMNLASTNLLKQQVMTQIEFSNPAWSKERTVIEIRGRDYGNPHGAAIDEIAKRITTSPVFKDLLVPVEGFKFTERPPQARTDPQDTENPDALFVPFTIELTFNNRIFAHE